jgi:pimeloyl-ACP methyl ester carboxylesterase
LFGSFPKICRVEGEKMHESQGVTRRQMLAGVALAPMAISTLGGLAMESGSNQTKHVTFVLVHGAWHGGWCWKKVVPLLQSAGHTVFTPTLTGLGERAHLTNPQIDLATHIEDITNVLEYEDLHNVVLVGHSYSGMVIAGVAEKAGERLAQLVYLDAFLPENGKSLKDYVPPEAPLDELAKTKGDGWRYSYTWQGTVSEMFGVTDSVDLAWVTPRLRDQPYRTFTQPVQLGTNTGNTIRRSYIQCSEGDFIFGEAAARAKKQGYRSYELFSARHDAMVTKPKELVDILLQLL